MLGLKETSDDYSCACFWNGFSDSDCSVSNDQYREHHAGRYLGYVCFVRDPASHLSSSAPGFLYSGSSCVWRNDAPLYEGEMVFRL